MADVTLPTTSRTLDSPSLAPDFTGIALVAPPSPVSQGRVTITGAYCIPEADAERIDAHLHNALVCVVNTTSFWQIVQPYRDTVLFGDDEQRTASGRLGYFSFHAFDATHTTSGDYYVFVSLGRFLSNVVAVRVGT